MQQSTSGTDFFAVGRPHGSHKPCQQMSPLQRISPGWMLNTSEECCCVMRKRDRLRRDEDNGHRQRQKLGPWDLANIRLKIKNRWCDSAGRGVQKLGPWDLWQASD